jgi:hypothetical protein
MLIAIEQAKARCLVQPTTAVTADYPSIHSKVDVNGFF